MENKKKYNGLEITIVLMQTQSVLTTSVDIDNDGSWQW